MGPNDLPDNAGYFQAAYLAAALLYLGYALLLVRRRARARSALGAAPRDGSGRALRQDSQD